MSAEIVPFGKYKGQPVEVLTSDQDYCEWLVSQPWFKSRYGNVYNILIQGGGEPQDSPEHNEMQARFLDDDWCFALADALNPSERDAYREPAVRRRLEADQRFQAFRELVATEARQPQAATRFEVKGWDVVYRIKPASISARTTGLPPCTCKCDHKLCRPEAQCHGGPNYCSHSLHKERSIDGSAKVKTAAHYHCGEDCPWTVPDTGTWLLAEVNTYHGDYAPVVRVEVKPDLGDDYPAVLRQVKGYPPEEYGYPAYNCVVVRRYGFESVTWDQVRKIFAASGITLVAEAELGKPR